MNKQDPNTHCFSVRCQMQLAAKVKTVADEQNKTCSEVVTETMSEKFSHVKASKKAKAWAAERYAVNLKRRKAADAQTKTNAAK